MAHTLVGVSHSKEGRIAIGPRERVKERERERTMNERKGISVVRERERGKRSIGRRDTSLERRNIFHRSKHTARKRPRKRDR